MSGVTDAPFRRLTAALWRGTRRVRDDASNDLVNGRPMSRLRMRGDGHRTACRSNSRAARQNGWRKARASLRPAGADIIDINMGCPARHVTGGQSGSALMRDLDHALKLIEATIAAVKVPVTLKMRLGWG
ncbi:MAG: tRNA-dihydrouridine synthase [Bradyrhizobium sp.]